MPRASTNLTSRIFKTRMGPMAFVAGDRGLRCVYLPLRDIDAQRDALHADFPEAVEDHQLAPSLVSELTRYFAGERVDFNVELDWTGHSPFNVRVWQACRKVGYGHTVSYGELASRIGCPGAARAVGGAMGRNPFPIVVPCHRVLKSDGTLGGYSGPGGVEWKRHLLELESTERERL